MARSQSNCSGSETEKGNQSPETDSIYGSSFPNKAGIVAEVQKGHALR